MHHIETYIIVPVKRVVNVLFLVTVTFNHANVLKLTGALIHTLLFTNAIASLVASFDCFH